MLRLREFLLVIDRERQLDELDFARQRREMSEHMAVRQHTRKKNINGAQLIPLNSEGETRTSS